MAFFNQVEERVIPVEDLLEADEAFCTGTAVVVTPIGAATYQGKRYGDNLTFFLFFLLFFGFLV